MLFVTVEMLKTYIIVCNTQGKVLKLWWHLKICTVMSIQRVISYISAF